MPSAVTSMAFSITFFQFRKKHIMADILYFRLNNNHFQKRLQEKCLFSPKTPKIDERLKNTTLYCIIYKETLAVLIPQ